jgi:hypothetical protein
MKSPSPPPIEVCLCRSPVVSCSLFASKLQPFSLKFDSETYIRQVFGLDGRQSNYFTMIGR